MRRFHITLCILTIMAILNLSNKTFALTADEIVNRANLAYYYAGEDSVARVKMNIKDSLGRKRFREMTMLRKDIKDGGRQDYYLYFHKPADVERMVFMVWKNIGRDDDRWLYIPAIDLVKRIAAKDKRSSFAGSHFTYEDVSGRSPSLDRHVLMGEGETGGRRAFIIKNTPKDSDIVEFSYFNSWIDKENFLPLRGEYFDKSGKRYRVIVVEEVKEIQGIPTVVKVRAEDVANVGETTVEFEDVRYNRGIKASIFKERYLRRPPIRWIR